MLYEYFFPLAMDSQTLQRKGWAKMTRLFSHLVIYVLDKKEGDFGYFWK